MRTPPGAGSNPTSPEPDTHVQEGDYSLFGAAGRKILMPKREKVRFVFPLLNKECGE